MIIKRITMACSRYGDCAAFVSNAKQSYDATIQKIDFKLLNGNFEKIKKTNSILLSIMLISGIL